MILTINYDLHNPGRDYDDIIKAIKTADSWAHPQGSLWLIDTLAEPSVWRDKLKNAGDANDEYFVARLQRQWASYGLSQTIVDWLNNPNRRW